MKTPAVGTTAGTIYRTQPVPAPKGPLIGAPVAVIGAQPVFFPVILERSKRRRRKRKRRAR